MKSLSYYDFRKWSCGFCAVDGGDDYFRGSGNEKDFEIILKEVSDMTSAKIEKQE